MKLLGTALAAFAMSTFLAPLHCEPVKLWETSGLKTPESALPVPAEGFAYVSNIGGQPTEKDGNGFISKVSLADGKIIELEWAKGMDAPKGLALAKGKLYTADIDKLVEIDAKTGKIVASYDAPGAKFLNDVAADRQGRIYVSDSGTSSIWRLADGKLEKWMDGPALKYPNGLLVQGDKLIVAAWGPPREDGTSAPANMLEVSIPDKTVRDLGDGKPIGNLDGLEPHNDAFLVTDWMAGALYRIDRTGRAELLLELSPGSADIGYVPAQRLLLIPMMKDDKLVAYKVQ